MRASEPRVLAGLAVGLVLSLATASLVRGILVGVGPRDPVTLLGVGVVLVVCAAVAVALPSWRAVTVDPVRALRD